MLFRSIGVEGNKRDTVVSLYHYFPLNAAKTMLHATPTVKVGDRVKEGDLIADTNFTRSGSLALGTNMRVAYTPYFGRTFEDSIVISESAAKKLASHHLHDMSVSLLDGMDVNKTRWAKITKPDRATPARLAKLDDQGIVRVGQTVEYGDVLAAVVAKVAPKIEDVVSGFIAKKQLTSPYSDKAADRKSTRLNSSHT